MSKWNPQSAQETRIHPVTNKLEKKCSKCGGVKPVEYFASHYNSKTGLKSKCKRCTNKTTGMKRKHENNIMKRQK